MNNKNWVGIGLVVIILVVIAYFMGQGSSNQSPTTENQIDTPPATQSQQQVQAPTPKPSYVAPAPRYYTPMTFSSAVEAQRNSYVNGCTSSGGMWGKCNCGFDYLINNYGLVWLINEQAYINVNGAASPQLRSASLSATNYCSIYSN